MNPATRPPVRLRRGILARFFGGWNFQWMLALSLAVGLGLLLVVGSLVGPMSLLRRLTGDPLSWLGLVWWAIWAMGVSAHAEADDEGIRWRYFVKHRYPWSAIDYIRFGGVMRAAGGGGSGTPGILMSVGGREHKITPGLGCATHRLIEFGDELIGLADAHGVAVRVDARNKWWRGLRGQSRPRPPST